MKSVLLKTFAPFAVITLLLGTAVSAAETNVTEAKAVKTVVEQSAGAASSWAADVQNALGLERPQLVVPEPSHSLLAMMGGLALFLRRRRQA